MENKRSSPEDKTSLGRSDLQVPRMGVGAMVWGDPRGLARLHPAKTAYGGSHGYEEEKRALEVSLEAGINLFDTAAMYSLGAAERRLGERARAARGQAAHPRSELLGPRLDRGRDLPLVRLRLPLRVTGADDGTT